jgi:mycobactin polyketide synthetase MbtD
MLDAYAERVRDDGCDCVSVQWGQWATYRGPDAANLAGVGYRAMHPDAAITLGLRAERNVAVGSFDWDRVRETLGHAPTLSRLTSPSPIDTAEASAVLAERPGEAPSVLTMFAQVIGAADVQALDTGAPLVALGLDSLNALRLRRRIKNELHCEVAVSDLLSGATLDDVAQLVGRCGPGR